MDVADAYGHLKQFLTIDVGSFYSGGEDLSLGVGKIYNGIRFPVYNIDRNLFQTASGLCYILTHECDIDQGNERSFNEKVLICPLIDFRIFIEEYVKEFSDEELLNFLANLGHRKISRVIYIPPHGGKDVFPYGALIYLNDISSTHISAFALESAISICAVTAIGLRIVDQALENHLLRPKTEPLALSH